MPRRNGERGIYAITPGVWRIRVSAGVDHARSTAGRVVYRSIERRVTGTMTEARAARARLIVESQQGRYGGTDATVGELLDAWLRELKRVGRAPSTLRGYRSAIDAHVRPTFGEVKVRKVTARLLADHLAGLTESGLAAPTVRKVMACLSSAFSQAMRWEWINKDPTKLVRGPAMANPRPKIPTVDEVVRLLAAAEESRTPETARAIWLSATTGVRRGELCGLRIGDFDLEAGKMTVERAISDESVWTTKNRRWREVSVDPLTVEVVRSQILVLELRAAEAGTVLAGDAYLFSDRPDGREPWRPDRVTLAFRRIAAREKLPVTFHQLRKFMESSALDAGFSVAEVAHRAGHDPAVLLRHYAGSVDESARKLGVAVASLLAPGGSSSTVRAGDS